MNDDELRDRLRDADPARYDVPADSWIDDLVEVTMSTTPETRRKRWVPLAAAAAVVAIAAGGVAVAMNNGDGGGTPQATQKTVTKLTIGGSGPAAGMCIRVTPETLQNTDLAFEGTATEVSGEQVTLSVDKWYKGGDTDLVQLTAATGADAVALEGGVDFVQGDKYLVSASDGAVKGCGFSAPDSPELEGLYAQAFGG
jgi:hypothetical protein